MNCPRCKQELLSERDRRGVTIDLCTGCLGVWLDRGELERLVSRAAREAALMEARRRRVG